METVVEEAVSPDELVSLCAIDDSLYARTFFPKTVRQATPEFHKQVDRALATQKRYVGIEIFRGGAKTSKLRIFCSKRIAYGISHTILFVSNAQSHSVKSIEWLKRQVEYNTIWAQTFGLRKGDRWSGEDIEIFHGVDEFPIRVLALGITGQVRGVNIDDYRPDLIIVDDPDDEETTGTTDQRKKTSDLFFGALAKSLAPASENPDAKMVLLQTPLHEEDLIESASKDDQWLHLRFGCFDAQGRSRWEERFPTETLLADKEAHIKRGQLALWMREMECAIIPEGGASFNPEALQYYTVFPERMTVYISVDPASSDSPTADDQVIMALGFHKHAVYVLEYTAHKGEMPDAAVVTLIQYIKKYRPIGIIVEAISYQRVLAWYVEQEMKRTRVFCPVYRVQDKRRKSDRIVQAISSVSAYSRLFVLTTHFTLISQYASYSPKSKAHDDILDALAMGIDYATQVGVSDWIDGEYTTVNDEDEYKRLEFRSCP